MRENHNRIRDRVSEFRDLLTRLKIIVYNSEPRTLSPCDVLLFNIYSEQRNKHYFYSPQMLIDCSSRRQSQLMLARRHIAATKQNTNIIHTHIVRNWPFYAAFMLARLYNARKYIYIYIKKQIATSHVLYIYNNVNSRALMLFVRCVDVLT